MDLAHLLSAGCMPAAPRPGPIAVTPPAATPESLLGLAGAPRVDWPFLNERARRGDWVFFGCNIEISRRYGRPNAGAADFLRQRTAALTPTVAVYDLGTLTAAHPAEAATAITNTAAMIAHFGGVPALVACDHTASLCALQGYVHIGQTPAVYVYFDAHFDLGRNWPADDWLHNGGFVGEILRHQLAGHVLNIGGRAPATKLPFPVTANFSCIPGGTTLSALILQLAPLTGKTIYVSLDADVLDPQLVPNVSCPEPDGMTGEDLYACCRWLGTHCEVLGADLSEVLPTGGSQGAETLLLSCLLALKN